MDIHFELEQLRSGEESLRREAIDRLGRSGLEEAIPPLLAAVGDESWPVRETATERLRTFDPTLLLPALEAALRDDEDAGLRNAAMEIYVKVGAPAVEPLLKLLVDRDEEVRNFAAVMLGSLEDKRSVGPLIAALKDPDINVGHAAAASLGRIGSGEAVLPLIEALSTGPWLQYPAINALAEIGEPMAVGALLPLLKDEWLQGPVMEALGRLAGREALPQLIPLLYDKDPSVRSAAVHAVVSIEQRATASGESLDPEVQAALRREDLIDHLLLSLHDEEPRNRRTAAITLGWLREPRAEAPLIDLLGEVGLQEHAAHALVSIGCNDRKAYARGLAHPDDTVRQGIIRCIAWIGPVGGIDLVAPLIHDPSPEVRAEAASAIGRLGDEDAAMLLFELLSDPNELIQESAMAALSRMESERVVPLLLQALSSPDEVIRIRAAETLTRLRDPDTAPSLMVLARDEKEAVRRAAVKALGEVDAPGVAQLLRSALLDKGSLVRQQAVISLGKLQDPDSVSDLLPLLDDPDPKLRFVVIRSLGQIRSPDTVPRLLLFLADKRKELRFAAVEALGSIRAVAAVRPLLAALSEPDRNLRRAVAESLGSIGDPQAIPPLLIALEDEHWSVRCAAATALGRIGSAKTTLPLLSRLDEEDPTVRRAAAAALGELRDARAASRLAEALKDPGLQATALEALRRIGVAALPDLERSFSRTPPEVRRLLVNLLGELDDRRARRMLLAALADDAASVRAEAALALGESGLLDALRPLMDLKASDPSPDVRQAASAALRKLAPR
jgi:HEAT repeat protein